MTEIDDNISKLRLELRRGIVVLAVLSQMASPQYGYSLVQSLAEQGLDVEEGTLYPLLRRLEKQGLFPEEFAFPHVSQFLALLCAYDSSFLYNVEKITSFPFIDDNLSLAELGNQIFI